MRFVERSYSGRLFRPRPETHVERDGRLLIAATPWGPRSSAQRAIQTLTDYFLSWREDNEATSPFEVLSSLSPMANHLRVAVMFANDSIYQEENRSEYKAGVELAVIARSPDELAIIQIGHPQIFLDRPGFNLIPVAMNVDLSVDLSSGTELLPPLPQNMLGVTRTSNFSVISLRPQPHDRLVLISRSILPPELYQVSRSERDLEHISRVLSSADPHNPFWLAVYEL